jgi:hypothetical protein
MLLNHPSVINTVGYANPYWSSTIKQTFTRNGKKVGIWYALKNIPIILDQ